MAQQHGLPGLPRLEEIRLPGEMTQEHYAEAWAWMHRMLESTLQRCELLQNHLARMRITGSVPPLSDVLRSADHSAIVRWSNISWCFKGQSRSPSQRWTSGSVKERLG